MLDQHRGGEEVVHRDVEKPLYGRSVQVHGQDSVGAGGRQKIRHELRRDGHPRLVLAVLARVAVIRQDRRDAGRRRTLEGVNDGQQFHQVRVDGRAGRLDHEHIHAPHVLQDLAVGLAVREPPRLDRAEGGPEDVADLTGQRGVRVAGEDLDVAVHRRRAHARTRRAAHGPPAGGWGGRIRTSGPGSKVQCLTT